MQFLNFPLVSDKSEIRMYKKLKKIGNIRINILNLD